MFFKQSANTENEVTSYSTTRNDICQGDCYLVLVALSPKTSCCQFVLHCLIPSGQNHAKASKTAAMATSHTLQWSHPPGLPGASQGKRGAPTTSARCGGAVVG